MLMPSIFGEDMFDDFMRDFPFFDENAGNKIEKKLYGRHAKNMMKTDIKEQEDGYEPEKKGKYIRQERYAGACQRSFYVGEDITEQDIKAEFKHGILKLFVPKKEAAPKVENKKYVAIEG